MTDTTCSYDIATDTWEYDNNSNATPRPYARRGHTASLVLGRSKSALHKLAKLANNPTLDNSEALDQAGDAREELYEEPESAAAPGSSLLETLESEMANRRMKDDPPAREMFVLGGAGPKSGHGGEKDYEKIFEELWIFNLTLRTWQNATAICTGLDKKQWARFEHTTTLVGKTLWVVGGISINDVTKEAGADGAEAKSYIWGRPESQVLSLDVETYVWTALETEHPSGTLNDGRPPSRHSDQGKQSESARSRFASQEEQGCLHGHTTMQNPLNKDQLLVFGGRGPQEPHNRVLVLDIPKSSKNSEQDFMQLLRHEAELPEGHVRWRDLEVFGCEAPSARYGHVCVAWRGAEQPENPSAAHFPSAVKGGKQSTPTTEELMPPIGAAGSPAAAPAPTDTGIFGFEGQSKSPENPGLVIFGGSLFTNGGGAYASHQLHFLELPGVGGSVSGSHSAADDGSLHAGSLQGSFDGGREEGSRQSGSVHGAGSFERGSASRDSRRASNVSNVEDVNQVPPSDYNEIKAWILSNRPDHHTSKLPKGTTSKPRTAPAFCVAAGALGTSFEAKIVGNQGGLHRQLKSSHGRIESTEGARPTTSSSRVGTFSNGRPHTGTGRPLSPMKILGLHGACIDAACAGSCTLASHHHLCLIFIF